MAYCWLNAGLKWNKSYHQTTSSCQQPYNPHHLSDTIPRNYQLVTPRVMYYNYYHLMDLYQPLYQQPQPYQQPIPHQQPWQPIPYGQPYQPRDMSDQPPPAVPAGSDTVLSPCAKKTTILIASVDLALTAVLIYCVVHILMLSRDYYNSKGLFYLYFYGGLSLYLLTYFTRLLNCFTFSCFPTSTRRQKLIMLVSVLTPSAKYYLFRKKIPEQHVKMLTISRWDMAGVVYFIVCGICILLVYNSTYVNPEMSTHDMIYMIFGQTTLTSAAIQIIVILLHKSWTQKQIRIQNYGLNVVQTGLPLGNGDYDFVSNYHSH